MIDRAWTHNAPGRSGAIQSALADTTLRPSCWAPSPRSNRGRSRFPSERRKSNRWSAGPQRELVLWRGHWQFFRSGRERHVVQQWRSVRTPTKPNWSSSGQIVGRLSPKVLQRGFYGVVCIKFPVQDGVIQHLVATIEESMK